VTVTVGIVLVTDELLIVALSVRAVPEVVPVKTDVYFPLPLSATVAYVPEEVPAPSPKATVKPPPVSRLPFASLAMSVTNVVSPEAIEVRATETVD
jgi:hypothetical protein